MVASTPDDDPVEVSSTRRLAPDDDPDPNELVQMNVRIPRGLRDRIDVRRRELETPLSRDKWVARAANYALTQPPTTTRRLAHTLARAGGVRTGSTNPARDGR